MCLIFPYRSMYRFSVDQCCRVGGVGWWVYIIVKMTWEWTSAGLKSSAVQTSTLRSPRINVSPNFWPSWPTRDKAAQSHTLLINDRVGMMWRFWLQ